MLLAVEWMRSGIGLPTTPKTVGHDDEPHPAPYLYLPALFPDVSGALPAEAVANATLTFGPSWT